MTSSKRHYLLTSSTN